MPNRILRDSILTSESVASLGWPEEVFYRRLMSVVDDYGRYEASVQLLRARCYPLQVDLVRVADISRWMAACQKAGLIVLYGVGGKQYLELAKFGQQLRSASKCPQPQSSDINCSQAVANEHLGVCVSVSVVSEACDPPDGGSPPIPFAEIVAQFNTSMTALPKVREITTKRKTAIRRAWQESHTRQALPFWKALFAEYADDAFTNGTGPYRNGHENWRPDFDYLMRPEVITKTYERAMHRMESEA